MVEDRDNLFYRPDLHPYREYGSEAVIPRTPPVNPDVPETPDIAKELIEDFEQVIDIIKAAPKGIDIIVPSIRKLIRRLQVAFPNGYYDDEPEKEVVTGPVTVNKGEYVEIEKGGSGEKTYSTPKNQRKLSGIGTNVYKIDKKIGSLPNLFPAPTNIVINVVKPRSIVDIAVDRYRKDTIDLQKYYLNQLQTALQAYFHQMMMVMAETNLPSIDNLSMDYDGKAVKIPGGKNLEHLHDYIVRSQVMREQKTRLFKKTHNVDQTVMHMRYWHVSEKERERYYTEKYGDSASYLDSEANSILRNSRSQYDKQYAQSLYDMYKYLNSSVIVIKDILDMSLNESKAKGQLLNKGVDIFAVTEKKVNVNDDVASAVGSGKLDEPKNKQSVDDKSKSTATTSTSTNSSDKTSDKTKEQSSKDVKDISNAVDGKTAANDAARAERDKYFAESNQYDKQKEAYVDKWINEMQNSPNYQGGMNALQWGASQHPEEYQKYMDLAKKSRDASDKALAASSRITY